MTTLLSFKDDFSYKYCQNVKHCAANFRKKTVFNNALLLDYKYAGGCGQQIIILLGKTEKS